MTIGAAMLLLFLRGAFTMVFLPVVLLVFLIPSMAPMLFGFLTLFAVVAIGHECLCRWLRNTPHSHSRELGSMSFLFALLATILLVEPSAAPLLNHAISTEGGWAGVLSSMQYLSPMLAVFGAVVLLLIAVELVFSTFLIPVSQRDNRLVLARLLALIVVFSMSWVWLLPSHEVYPILRESLP